MPDATKIACFAITCYTKGAEPGSLTERQSAAGIAVRTVDLSTDELSHQCRRSEPVKYLRANK